LQEIFQPPIFQPPAEVVPDSPAGVFQETKMAPIFEEERAPREKKRAPMLGTSASSSLVAALVLSQ